MRLARETGLAIRLPAPQRSPEGRGVGGRSRARSSRSFVRPERRGLSKIAALRNSRSGRADSSYGEFLATLSRILLENGFIFSD